MLLATHGNPCTINPLVIQHLVFSVIACLYTKNTLPTHPHPPPPPKKKEKMKKHFHHFRVITKLLHVDQIFD